MTVRLPGPPELLPRLPDAVVDLQTKEGVDLVAGTWRYHDASLEQVEFVDVGEDLGPSGPPNVTSRVTPDAGGTDFDDGGWRILEPSETMARLTTGMVSFNWYRIRVRVPELVGDFDPTGSTAVFEVVVDDYAEVWVDGKLPLALGDSGGHVIGGFNCPNRVVLGEHVRPGDEYQIAVFGVNGPISAAPRNYIWIRSATVDFHRSPGTSVPAPTTIERFDPGLDHVLDPAVAIEQIAGGFEFTEGPVWTADGALLFSSPNTNCIYRWARPGQITVFRAKSGHTGHDIGRYHQPGSNGLAFDPQGRLTICQHGNRRVLRVEPRGNTTVLADRFDGKRLNSPNDLVYRSDGTLYFTDPPFGLPDQDDDPARELEISGVYRVSEGAVTLVTGELRGPNGVALSPDEQVLYVGDWDPDHKAVMGYPVEGDSPSGLGRVIVDLTDEPGDDAIDGLEVDREGNLYVCGPGGIWVVRPDGTKLGLIRLPEAPHNLTWGDGDRRTLYVTAETGIYRVPTRIGGQQK